MFDWLWKRLRASSGRAAQEDDTTGNNTSTTSSGPVKVDAQKGATIKEVKAVKAKPTVAKTKKFHDSASALTAVRTGNTRPNRNTVRRGTHGDDDEGVKIKNISGATITPTTTTTTTSTTASNTRGRPRSSFDEMYERLVQYKSQHGTCSVPANYEDDKPLASFVRRTRRQYKDIQEWEASTGQKLVSTKLSSAATATTNAASLLSFGLTLDQIQRLEMIDFEWEGKRGRKTKASASS